MIALDVAVADIHICVLQITNNSAYSVSISHNASPKHSSNGKVLWNYIYPRTGDDTSVDAMVLSPFRSANVVLSISESTLKEYLDTQTTQNNCSYAEARRRLAATIEFHWKIVEPLSGHAPGVPHVARVGRLALLMTDSDWDDCLKLSRFTMTLDAPAAALMNGAASHAGATALAQDIPQYVSVSCRKFHRFGVNITLDERVQGCRRYMEIAFIVTCASGEYSPSAGSDIGCVHCPHSVVITGSPHKILAVSEGTAESAAPSLHHEVGICFTKYGLYHVFVFARCRYRPILSKEEGSGGGDGTSEERVASWWTLQQPIAVAVK